MNDALYTYGVIGAGTTPPPIAHAILPGAALIALREGELAALASPVPRAWFEAGPECRTEDAAWLAERAAAHHGVLAGMAGAVLPMAFGAVFSGEAPLRAWLRERAQRLSAALQDMRGHQEWSVTLIEDVAAHEAWLAVNDPGLVDITAAARHSTPGTAFMLARRRDRALADARQARRQDSARALGIMLAGLAGRVYPAATRQPQVVAGFNMLVSGEAMEGLRASLTMEARAMEGTGLGLRLSGPWPPYAYAREATRAHA